MRFHRATGMRAFWLTWVGLLLTFTGSGLTRFGLSVWVFQETRDPQSFSTLLFFATVPMAVGAVFAGPFVDRWNRRSVLLISNIVASIPTLLVMLLFLADRLELWHLYSSLFVNGLANAFILPAFDASIRQLVPVERLGQASGLAQMIQSLGVVIAPPIAGFVLVQFGLGAIFFMDFATFALAALLLLFVYIPPVIRELVTEKTSVWQDFIFGLRYMLERPPFLFLMTFLTLVISASAFVYALSGPLVLGFSDESSLGIVYAAYGFGGFLGAVAVSITGGSKRRMHGMLGGAMLLGISSMLIALRPDTLLISLSLLVYGASMTSLIALNRTIYQEKAAPEVLGRIFAFRIVVGVGAQALGLLVAGWLAATIFEPGMMAGGALSEMWGGFFGNLLGSGEGRGAALLTGLIGAGIFVFAVLCSLFPGLRLLEDKLPTYGQRTAPSDVIPTGRTADAVGD